MREESMVTSAILLPVSLFPVPSPLAQTKQDFQFVGTCPDTDKLLLFGTCVKDQLRIMSGPESLDIVQSSYQNMAYLPIS
jgi:hypothetical protein